MGTRVYYISGRSPFLSEISLSMFESFGTFLFPPSEDQVRILMEVLVECKVPFLIVQGLATPAMVEAMHMGVSKSDGRGMMAVWARQHGEAMPFPPNRPASLIHMPLLAVLSHKVSLYRYFDLRRRGLMISLGHMLFPHPLRLKLCIREPIARLTDE